MRLLDRIALNRAMIIIGHFILSLIKILMPKLDKDLDNNPLPPTPRPPLLRPRNLRKKNNDK
jgi:hypothetical protein